MTAGDEIVNDNEPLENDYTTWTVREDGEEIIRTIDYIFYSPTAFDIEGVAEIPNECLIGKERLPSCNYPSDHLSLVTEFKFSRRT